MPPSAFEQLIAFGPADWAAAVNRLSTDLLLGEDLEQFVTILRRELLDRVLSGERGGRINELLAALAIFCRDCEFVMNETPAETLNLQRLGGDPAEAAMRACYRKGTVDVLPYNEVECIGTITEPVSLTVQKMYDENPFPRWKSLPFDGAPNAVSENILIAGCGSGHHAIMTALGSPQSAVTGIDLSVANLAYGLAKAREYGVANLRLAQCDMNQATLLNQVFDNISAVGSVHHVADPLRAVAALKEVLKPGGILKLALYSTHGRAPVLEVIALRRREGISSTPEGIRRLRQLIYALPRDHPARRVTNFVEFFSLSGCRDMLFHVQEHNYTVAQLFDFIAQTGMDLAWFQLPGAGQAPAPARAAVEDLERRDPGFAGPMFRFGLRKK